MPWVLLHRLSHIQNRVGLNRCMCCKSFFNIESVDPERCKRNAMGEPWGGFTPQTGEQYVSEHQHHNYCRDLQQLWDSPGPLPWPQHPTAWVCAQLVLWQVLAKLLASTNCRQNREIRKATPERLSHALDMLWASQSLLPSSSACTQIKLGIEISAEHIINLNKAGCNMLFCHCGHNLYIKLRTNLNSVRQHSSF